MRRPTRANKWFVFQPSCNVMLPRSTDADLERFVQDPTAAKLEIHQNPRAASLSIQALGIPVPQPEAAPMRRDERDQGRKFWHGLHVLWGAVFTGGDPHALAATNEAITFTGSTRRIILCDPENAVKIEDMVRASQTHDTVTQCTPIGPSQRPWHCTCILLS